jgi:hypothetical protein
MSSMNERQPGPRVSGVMPKLRAPRMRAALIILGALVCLTLPGDLRGSTKPGGVHTQGYLTSLGVSMPLALSLLAVIALSARFVERSAGRILAGGTFVMLAVVGLLELGGLSGNVVTRVGIFDVVFFGVVTVTALVGLAFTLQPPSVG